MNQLQNIQQLREFLSVYNTLTERCFSSCIRDYNSNTLTGDESSCVNRCIEKQMLVNRRFMVVFAEQAPKVIFKQGDKSKTEAVIAADKERIAEEKKKKEE